MDDFNRIFGRKISPFIETYKMEDAQYAFFIQGAHANTCKNAINNLRKQGLKIGMVRPRWIRPWPTVQEIAEALSKVKAVARCRDQYVLRRGHEGRKPDSRTSCDPL